jgi:5'-nucleotidase
MPQPADLVIAVASSALFDLTESDTVFRQDGAEAYRQHQREREEQAPPPGVAMPFVKRLLAAGGSAVEVVLLSRNNPETGMRVRHAIEAHQLPIKRLAFTGGREPYPLLEAFEASLFLSANRVDVEAAIAAGWAAGVVTPSPTLDADTGDELRIAFDFDGVLADDGSERLYKEHGLAAYHAAEAANHDQALTPGPLHRFLLSLAKVQRQTTRIRTAIITARSAPADRRVFTSLRAWGVTVDESYFVGDLPKDRIIRQFRPHLFFDDKRANADLGATAAPSVHVPFGVLNGR